MDRDASATGVAEVTTGLRFPEGPIALPDGDVLLVEIARGTLTRVTPSGGQCVVAQLGGGPNGAAIGPDGACYVCNNGGFRWQENEHGLRPAGQAEDYTGGSIQRVDLATGAFRTLYSSVDGRACRRRTTSCSIGREASGSPTPAPGVRARRTAALFITPRPTANPSPKSSFQCNIPTASACPRTKARCMSPKPIRAGCGRTTSARERAGG